MFVSLLNKVKQEPSTAPSNNFKRLKRRVIGTTYTGHSADTIEDYDTISRYQRIEIKEADVLQHTERTKNNIKMSIKNHLKKQKHIEYNRRLIEGSKLITKGIEAANKISDRKKGVHYIRFREDAKQAKSALKDDYWKLKWGRKCDTCNYFISHD